VVAENNALLIGKEPIYKNPDYLFFDEATSGWNAENEKAFPKT